MRDASVRASPLIEWAVATLPLPGQTQSGDLHLVKPLSRGTLVAVVDGLGHGEEAAAAARLAVTTLERHADEFLLPLVERCHAALHGSRGVVMSLAFVDATRHTLTWLGVGNVEGVLKYADGAMQPVRASLIVRGGIVGSELPRLRAEVLRVTPGDLLVFATDGIRQGFADTLSADATPQQLADDILARHSKGTDDALVLAARYLGRGPRR